MQVKNHSHFLLLSSTLRNAIYRMEDCKIQYLLPSVLLCIRLLIHILLELAFLVVLIALYKVFLIIYYPTV